MSVFRVEKTKGYTVMSNHHLRNHALSLKAKGLLSQMLSLPEDWDYTLPGLSLIHIFDPIILETAQRQDSEFPSAQRRRAASSDGIRPNSRKRRRCV